MVVRNRNGRRRLVCFRDSHTVQVKTLVLSANQHDQQQIHKQQDCQWHRRSPMAHALNLINKTHMGLRVVRGKIHLPKVEHPKFEGHVTPNEDEHQTLVHATRFRLPFCGTGCVNGSQSELSITDKVNKL